MANDDGKALLDEEPAQALSEVDELAAKVKVLRPGGAAFAETFHALKTGMKRLNDLAQAPEQTLYVDDYNLHLKGGNAKGRLPGEFRAAMMLASYPLIQTIRAGRSV